MLSALECLLKCHLGCFTINNESSCHSVREKGEGAQRNSYSEAKGGFTPSMISTVNINFACDSYVFNQLQLEKMIQNARGTVKIDIHRENCRGCKLTFGHRIRVTLCNLSLFPD
jgi:hypothetical protein